MTKRDTMGLFRKKGVVPMEPWTPDADMAGVSVGDDDKSKGSPKEGDMIAHDADNPADKWLVNAAYFAKFYEPAD